MASSHLPEKLMFLMYVYRKATCFLDVIVMIIQILVSSQHQLDPIASKQTPPVDIPSINTWLDSFK